MATTKNFLDYAGLQAYDGKIKEWANGVNQLGYKTILKSEDGNKLYFFTKPNATLVDIIASGANATPYVELGSADIANQISALASILGATWDSSNEEYTISLDSNFPQSVETAVDALNDLKGAVDTLNGDDATAGSVAKAIKDAIESLDVTEFAIAEKDTQTNIITIHGISESDGSISVGENAANDIVLAAVAGSGEASDVANDVITGVTKIVNGSPVATTNVQDTLAALKALIDKVSDDNSISVEEVSTGLAANILKAYKFYQGDSSVAANLKGTINIPKDFLVKSANVSTVTAEDKATGGKFENNNDYAVGDIYMDFVINTKDSDAAATEEHIYINAKSLIKALTVEANAEEIQLALSNSNELSATVVEIPASKILYKAAHEEGGETVPAESVEDALNNISSISSTDINALFTA